jgi:hypothetical protein
MMGVGAKIGGDFSRAQSGPNNGSTIRGSCGEPGVQLFATIIP